MGEEPQEHRAPPHATLPLPFSRKDLAQLSAALLACREIHMTRETLSPSHITFTATTIPVSHPWPTIMAVQLRVSMPRMEWVQTFESTGEMVRFVWGE